MTPKQVYERQWAVTLLKQVLHRLQCEMEAKGRGAQFAVLKETLIGRPDQGYAQVAGAPGVNTAAVRIAASRLRRRYRELLREEILQTVSSPEEADDEIRHLFQVLSHKAPPTTGGRIVLCPIFLSSII